MDENKLNIVRAYLNNEFPDDRIEEKYDFDRSAQTFRIRSGKDLLLLKIGEEFLGDNDDEQIGTHLENWQIANLLKENKGLGIFVGNSMPVAFNRFV